MNDTTDEPAPDEPEARKRFRYIPAFDGMRGFWVIVGPLLYHARPSSIRGGPDIAPGGILSLDLFFVLSSYLIVGIALREWDDTGRIDLIAYAGRRVRRLFPALFLAIGLLSIYLAIVDDPEIIDRWTGAIVSALTYSANWHEIAADVSYFEQFGAPSPLKHVWSFAIEEQFYLFAPLFLIAGLRGGGRRGREILLALSVCGALASAWWMTRVHVEGQDPSRAYYGTDTRAQALFVGIAMALAVDLHGSPRTRIGTRIAALLAYPATAWHLWAVLTVSERDTWLFEKGGFLAIAVAAGVAMFGLSQDAPWSPLHRLFASPPFRYTGRISYGLYLYHWPIYLLLTPERAGSPFGVDRVTGLPLLGIHLTLTLLVSITSFHLLEQPFVKRQWPISLRPLMPSSAAFAGATAVVVILAGLLWANSNRPNDIEQVLIPVPATDTGDTDNIDFGRADIAGADAGDGIDQTEGLEMTTSSVTPEASRILVVGDSVSAQIGWALHRWGEDNPNEIVVFNESHIGCGVVRYGKKRVDGTSEGPVGDICSNWNVPVAPHEVADTEVVSWPTAIELFQPDIVLAIVSSWDAVDRIVPGVSEDWTAIGDPVFDDYALSEYIEANEVLSASGADVYWLMSPYLNRALLPGDHRERVDGLNAIVEEAVATVLAADSTASITLVDYGAWIGDVGGIRETRLRDDGVHLSATGFAEIGPWLIGEIGLIPVPATDPGDPDNVDRPGAAPSESPLYDDATAAYAQGTIRILVVGDSVMDQIGVALTDWTVENPEVGIVAFNESHIGCGTIREGEKRVPDGLEGPVGDICSDWAEPVDPGIVSEYDVVSWSTILDVFRPDVIVTHVSPWDVSDRRVPGVNDGEWTHVGEPVFDEYAQAEYAAAIELLTSDGADLYILAGAPLNWEIKPQNDPARIAALNEIVTALAAEAGDNVSMVDYPGWVGPVGSDQELSRRDDGIHLSDTGLLEVVPWLLDQIGIDAVS